MQIERRREGDTTVISPVGRLYSAGAPAFEQEVSSILAEHPHRIVLDGTRMSYISSAGVRAVLVWAKTCRELGTDLAVAALRPPCRRVFELCGLLHKLDYHDNVAQATAPRQRSAHHALDPGRARRAPKMTLETRTEGTATVIAVNGRLDTFGVTDLEAAVRCGVDNDTQIIVIDVRAMTYIDSSGLRAVLVCAKQCQQNNRHFIIARLQKQCHTVFQMSGFLTCIDYHESLDKALEANEADDV